MGSQQHHIAKAASDSGMHMHPYCLELACRCPVAVLTPVAHLQPAMTFECKTQHISKPFNAASAELHQERGGEVPFLQCQWLFPYRWWRLHPETRRGDGCPFSSKVRLSQKEQNRTAIGSSKHSPASVLLLLGSALYKCRLQPFWSSLADIFSSFGR